MTTKIFHGEKAARRKPLFEPLLFALPCPSPETYAQEQPLDYVGFYCQLMKAITTPQKAVRPMKTILQVGAPASARNSQRSV